MPDIKKTILPNNSNTYDIMPARVDTTPTADSNNMVTSAGIKTYADTVATNAVNSWFLRGPIIAAGTNFNTLTTPGHYYVNSITNAQTMTNIPVEYSGRLEVTATNSNTEYLRQTYYANTDSTGLICIRRQNTSDTGWSKWVILPTPTDVISSVFSTGVSLNGYSSLDNLTPGNYYASNDTIARAVGAPYTRSGFNLWVIATTSTTRRVQLLFPNPYGTETNTKGFFLLRQEVAGTWEGWHTITNHHGIGNATIVGSGGINLDTLKTPGVWITGTAEDANASSGRPDYANSASKIWRLDVYNMNTTRVWQELTVYRVGAYEGEFDRYIRMSRTDGTWNTWKHIDTTDVSTYYPTS